MKRATPGHGTSRAATGGTGCRRRFLAFALGLWVVVCLELNLGAQVLDPRPGFEAANTLYEQGHYTEAATAYQTLIQGGIISPAVYLNLGNAWFKAGQKGQAIAAYRAGLRLAPRDPSLRFNLQFVRKEAAGEEAPAGRWWERWLASLTVNEWTVVFVCAFWLWFGLLVTREIRPGWRKSLRGYTGCAGLIACLLAFCVAAAIYQQAGQRPAVVITPEVVVRYTPLEVSPVFFKLQDGLEVSVLDEQPGQPTWFLIKDGAGREGWLKRDEVMLITASPYQSMPR
jgi:hypothetical protein